MQKQLKFWQQRYEQVRNDTEAIDLQLEALKLLVKKYKSSFPSTILTDIEGEYQKAQKKVDNATTRQELSDAEIEQKRWKALLFWCEKNL